MPTGCRNGEDVKMTTAMLKMRRACTADSPPAAAALAAERYDRLFVRYIRRPSRFETLLLIFIRGSASGVRRKRDFRRRKRGH